MIMSEQRGDPALRIHDRRLGVGGGDRATERIGELVHFVVFDPAGIERDDRRSRSRRSAAFPAPIPTVSPSPPMGETRRRLQRVIGTNAPIDLWCERPVHFGTRASQARLAFLERGIIEEREFHRALDLEHAVAGEKYRRPMGVDSLHAGAAMNFRVASGNRRPVAACRRVRSECAVSGNEYGQVGARNAQYRSPRYTRKRGGDATIAQTLRWFDPDQSNRQGRGVVDTRDASGDNSARGIDAGGRPCRRYPQIDWT